jgi:hypothetical protein
MDNIDIAFLAIQDATAATSQHAAFASAILTAERLGYRVEVRTVRGAREGVNSLVAFTNGKVPE